ncbi:hypothetical protein GmRootA79_41880 [Acidovorax sp. A79]|uniref:hypothetical protein n=1 Tax=Acidovorax sp. A79 TaxID=3056107 RepID=UPI0034E8D817
MALCLAETGVITGAHILGQDGGWSAVVKYGTTEQPLAAQRSRQVRLFRKYFKPGGKLDSGPEGGHYVGKSWKFKSDQVCRDYYQNSVVHCGAF